MIEYLLKAVSVFLLGFAPMVEIPVPVTTGIVTGMDMTSAIAWSVAGNFAPILLLHQLYNQLLKVPRFAAWTDRVTPARVREKVEAGGFWFYLIMTPFFGTWTMAAAVNLLKIHPSRFLLPTFLSVLIYGLLAALLIAAGVELVHP
jgi:uncharacterized membrane protein